MADNVKENKSGPVKRVPCEVYSRIVGYLRPVQDWNRGKQQEFAERRMYAVQEPDLGSLDLFVNPDSSDDAHSGAGRSVEQQQLNPTAES